MGLPSAFLRKRQNWLSLEAWLPFFRVDRNSKTFQRIIDRAEVEIWSALLLREHTVLLVFVPEVSGTIVRE